MCVCVCVCALTCVCVCLFDSHCYKMRKPTVVITIDVQCTGTFTADTVQVCLAQSLATKHSRVRNDVHACASNVS